MPPELWITRPSGKSALDVTRATSASLGPALLPIVTVPGAKVTVMSPDPWITLPLGKTALDAVNTTGASSISKISSSLARSCHSKPSAYARRPVSLSRITRPLVGLLPVVVTTGTTTESLVTKVSRTASLIIRDAIF